MISFESSLNLNLSLVSGILEHITNLQPGKLWSLRQLNGYNLVETIEAWKQRLEEAKRIISQDTQAKEDLREFYDKTQNAFQKFLAEGREGISDYLQDKEFYLVTGASRTGGTYLQTEISKAVDWPVKDLLFSMTHDEVCCIPYVRYVTNKEHKVGSMGWRIGENYYNCIFQLLQMLVYIEEVIPEKDQIVLKNIHYSQCIPLLDHIFGEQAHYLVTVRHPAAVSASINSREKDPLSKEEYRQIKEGKFDYWKVFYHEFVRGGVPEGQVTPLLFGVEMDGFLTQFFSEQGYEGQPSGIKITPRTYDREYWNSSEIVEGIKKIERLWDLYGLDFPVPKQIL